MKCAACDVLLSEAELLRVHPSTGEFIDLCGDCHGHYRAAVEELEEVQPQHVPIESE